MAARWIFLVALLCWGCAKPTVVVDELTADPARLEDEARRVAAVAAGQGRAVLLYFHAGWCEPCERLKPAFRRPTNRGLFARYFLVKVDVDQLPSTRVLGLNVSAIPLFARLSQQGAVAGTLSGEAFGEQPADEVVDEVLARFLAPGPT